MIEEANVKFPDIPFKQTAALIIIGIIIYLGYLYVVGFDSVKDVLLRANYLYLALAILTGLTAIIFHTAGWWILLKDKGYSTSFFNAYLMYLSSIFFVNLIPTVAVSGEVSKIYFVEKSTPDTRFDKTLATCIVTRVLEFIPIILGATVGVLYLAFFYGLPLWETAICLLAALALILLVVAGVYVAMNNALLRRLSASGFRLLGRLLKKDLSARAGHFDAIVAQFDASFKEITAKKSLVAASFILIFIAWCFDVSVAYVASLAVGYTVAPLLIIMAYSILLVLQMFPIFLPGGIGVVDIIMTALYMAVGISKEGAAGATIMARFVTLCFLTIAGGLATLYLAKACGKNNAK